MKPVLVEWIDAQTVLGDSYDKDSLPPECRRVSVGFLVKRDRHSVDLATDYTHGEDKPFGIVHRIPRGMVKKITPLTVKAKP